MILFAFPFLSASECGKKEKNASQAEEITESREIYSDSIPVCVQRLIDAGKKEDPPTSPVQVDEYLYKGQKVYLLTAQCCDFYNEVYDTSCVKICAPTGGFTGKGDGKCPDFSEEAKLIKTIWKEKLE